MTKDESLSPHYLLFDINLIGMSCQSGAQQDRRCVPPSAAPDLQCQKYPTGQSGLPAIIKPLEIQGIGPCLNAVRNSLEQMQFYELQQAAQGRNIDAQLVMDAYMQHRAISPLVRQFELYKHMRPVVPVVLWDGQPIFRQALLNSYKQNRLRSEAHRPTQDPVTGEMCPSVYEAFHAIRPVLFKSFRMLGFAQLRCPHAEADDLAYQLTQAILDTDPGALVTVHTEDSDWLQILALQDQRVAWWGLRERTPDKKYAKPEDETGARPWLTLSNFSEWTGFDSPRHALRIKGMAGDRTDDIPGLPGVGEKRAREFMSRFGSWEQFLEQVATPEGLSAAVQWMGNHAWRRQMLSIEARRTMSKSAWLTDLSLSPSVSTDLTADYRLFDKSGESLNPAPSHNNIAALKREDLMRFYQSQDAETKHIMGYGGLGLCRETSFRNYMKSLGSEPWFLTPGVEPQQIISGWFDPVHQSSSLRTALRASAGLALATHYLHHNTKQLGFENALKQALKQLKDAENMVFPQLPPAPPEAKQERGARKKQKLEQAEQTAVCAPAASNDEPPSQAPVANNAAETPQTPKEAQTPEAGRSNAVDRPKTISRRMAK